MSLLVGDLVMMIVSGRGMWKCVSVAHIWALGGRSWYWLSICFEWVGARWAVLMDLVLDWGVILQVPQWSSYDREVARQTVVLVLWSR